MQERKHLILDLIVSVVNGGIDISERVWEKFQKANPGTKSGVIIAALSSLLILPSAVVMCFSFVKSAPKPVLKPSLKFEQAIPEKEPEPKPPSVPAPDSENKGRNLREWTFDEPRYADAKSWHERTQDRASRVKS